MLKQKLARAAKRDRDLAMKRRGKRSRDDRKQFRKAA